MVSAALACASWSNRYYGPVLFEYKSTRPRLAPSHPRGRGHLYQIGPRSARDASRLNHWGCPAEHFGTSSNIFWTIQNIQRPNTEFRRCYRVGYIPPSSPRIPPLGPCYVQTQRRVDSSPRQSRWCSIDEWKGLATALERKGAFSFFCPLTLVFF